ncbi:MAG: hypothetical protein Q9226_005370 [Calogaya cf. arnoldii]
MGSVAQRFGFLTDPLGQRPHCKAARMSSSPMVKEAPRSSELAASRFKFSIVDVNTRRHPVIANMSMQSIDVYDRYSIPCSPQATPRQGNTEQLEQEGSVGRDEIDNGEGNETSKTVVETDDDLRTLVAITGIWVAFCENWSPHFRYSTKQVISNGISELSNRRRMDDAQPLALSADDRRRRFSIHHSNMSAPRRDQYNQVSNSAGTNNSTGNDTTWMNQGFPAFPQPTFGQWPASQAWGSTPLPGYNFNLPLLSDFSSNNGFFQNQQNELPDSDGNDDFYDNDLNKTDNASKLTVNSKHSPGSLPAQAKLATPASSHVEASKGLAVDPSNRAAQLRAQLLASRRPGSTTPSAPRSGGKEMNNAKMNMRGGEREKKGIDDSSVEYRPKSGGAAATPKDPSSSQSADKSSQIPSIAQSLPTQNADIEGLIDEYRASEADKTSSLAVVGTHTLGPKNGRTSSVANGSHAVGTLTRPKPIRSVSPKLGHAGSPGSPESGEIHSDQEPAISNGQGGTKVEKVNDEPRKAVEKRIDVDKPDNRQVPTSQSRADDSKQTTVPSKSRQSSLLQTTDQRNSVNTGAEPRNIPLAQRITHIREEELPSPSLRTRNTNVHGRDTLDKVDNLDRQQPVKPSSVIAQSRPRLPSRSQQEIKKNEDLAALYKRQLVDQNTPSPRSKIASNGGGKSDPRPAVSHDKPDVNGTSANDTVAKPVKQHVPKTTSLGISSSDQGVHVLTQRQHEQIRKMGIDMSPQGLCDLYEFLEYHRYYVPEYREGFFARQKRLRALEAEKLALERESLLQFDHFTSMRSQSLAAREQTEPPTPVPVHRTVPVETAAVKPMPPPLTLPMRSSNGATGDLPNSAGSLKSATRTNENVAPSEGPQTSPSTLKRHRLDDDRDLDQSKKIARVDPNVRGGRSQDISPRTTAHDQVTHDRSYASDQRPAGYDFRGRSRSPRERRRSLSAHRRASDFGHPSRQNSWVYNRENEYSASRDQDYRRPSDDGRRRESAGHPEERKPSYPSYNYPSHPNRGSRGGFRGGRSGYQTSKPRAGYSSPAVNQTPSGWKNSESVDLKAGGQSRSESSGLDLP